jgi:hypothetical protein
MTAPVCDYCKSKSQLVYGDAIYPHRRDLWEKVFYQCKPCKAYVGCHPGTSKPLGRLANAQLRAAKSHAHQAFDPLWKSRRISRAQAYQWLAEQLGIDPKDCHIGMFDVPTCTKVLRICAAERARLASSAA